MNPYPVWLIELLNRRYVDKHRAYAIMVVWHCDEEFKVFVVVQVTRYNGTMMTECLTIYQPSFALVDSVTSF